MRGFFLKNICLKNYRIWRCFLSRLLPKIATFCMRAHSTKAPQNVKIYYTFYPANRSEVQTIDWGQVTN